MMQTQDLQTASLTELDKKPSAFSFKRVFLVLLFIFWSIALLVVGIYFGEKLGAEPYIVAQNNREGKNAKPVGLYEGLHPVVTDSSGATSSVLSVFQKTLNEKCGQIIPGDSRSFIRLEDLPVGIDTSVLRIEVTEGKTTTATNTFLCLWGNLGKNYALSDNLSVYDVNSEELGHGGAPYFGFAGTEVPGINDVRLGVRLTSTDAGPQSSVDTSVVMRGVRSIRLSNGEQIFVSTDDGMISGGDPRLAETLKKYSEPISQKELELFGGSPGDLVISDFDRAQSAVAVEFFGDGLNLRSPEREKVNRLLEVLNAVSPK